MKKINITIFLLILFFISGCSESEKTEECKTFLECLDGS